MGPINCQQSMHGININTHTHTYVSSLIRKPRWISSDFSAYLGYVSNLMLLTMHKKYAKHIN